jgi:outer membrane protein assembly factor BamB
MTQQKTCVAAPTPASDGRRVFALFSSNDLICLDLDGNLLWLRGLTHDYPNASNSLGLASSPTCASDTLVVLIENEGDPFAAGIDTATGVNRWKQPRHKITCWTSPVVFSDKAGRQVVALQSKNGITAVLPATGEVAWRFETEASQIPSCAAANGILYVPSRGLVALQPDAAGGPPKELWRTSQLAVATPSPVPLGDRVFTVNGAGVLTCGEAATGKRLWQLRLKGPFSSTPVAAGGRMYLVNEKGLVQVVDITQSQGALISELDLAQTVLCTPAIANGAIYVRSDGRLWKLAKP